MNTWYTIEWIYKREDGLYGSESTRLETKEEVDAFVEKIKTNPYKKVQECWVSKIEKII